MANMEKRRRIMKRSIRLGHCICDPQKPCPCDLFKEKDICLCAGERLEAPTGPVQLTKLVEKAGCASKIDQAFLKQVLKDLPTFEDPRVLVGVPAGDDAGIYDMGNGKALVQTVDVFTPSVDDPYTFGQVAAANSVSDIYAMGGTPMTALSVLGFPVRKVPDRVMNEILCGGIDKMKEAGVSIIGGHSINDAEIKAGFAVTGIIEKDKVVTNSGARAGDILILTKPLGTGIVAFAAQIGRAKKQSIEASVTSMTSLNKKASELMVKFKAHACTDVTGFSLLGHLTEMALQSGVDAEIIWDDLPLLPGVLQYIADGILPGAIERNKESCSERVVATDSLQQEMVDMCYDAQTSGGLLIAISEDKADKFLKSLHAEGIVDAAIVGRIRTSGSGRVFIETTGERKLPKEEKVKVKRPAVITETSPKPGLESAKEISKEDEPVCCADGHTDNQVDEMTGIKAVQANFDSFLASVGKPGGLDAYTKQTINIALSVLSRCQPCIKAHINKAKKMGFSPEEIDEAAWMGIAFGGSPVMMFYKGLKDS
ncbi:MAG: selenide, water dikinase SelD [Planctomycetota bacterium]|jgi:selenide,water dikinase